MKEKYIEVVFRSERTGFFANKLNLNLTPNTIVVVKVDHGEDIGRVLNTSVAPEEIENIEKITYVLRIATSDDLQKLNIIKQEEEKAKDVFVEILKKYSFKMRLIDVVYQFDGNKLIFFFAADTRIDFREFVRELANNFKTRIELHQSSGREDARRYGGVGTCGKEYCCITFLKSYDQVSIKMAKDQNLLNNLSKLTGPCGRLLCCLAYEEDYYVKRAKEFPTPGHQITYKKKKMFVQKNDIITDTIYLTNEEKRTVVLSLDEYKKIHKNGR